MNKRLLCLFLSVILLFTLTACKKGGRSAYGNINELSGPNPGDIYAEFEFLDFEEKVTFKLFPQLAPRTVELWVTRAERGFYDGRNIHRVIQDSLIQGGSINFDGTDGNIAPQEFIPIETSPHARHFYGALAMVNMGRDQSYCQFYIVTNNTPRDVDAEIKRIQAILDDKDMMPPLNAQARTRLNNDLNALKSIPDNVKQLYETRGGEFGLDGQATVFGQLVAGSDVINAIAKAEVAAGNSIDDERGVRSKPIEEIIIKSVTIIKIPSLEEEEPETTTRGRGDRTTPPVTDPVGDLTETIDLNDPIPPPNEDDDDEYNEVDETDEGEEPEDEPPEEEPPEEDDTDENENENGS